MGVALVANEQGQKLWSEGPQFLVSMVFLVRILFSEGHCHLNLLHVPEVLLDLLAMSLLYNVILFIAFFKVVSSVLRFVVRVHGVLVINIFTLIFIHKVYDLSVILSGHKLAFY